MAALPQLKTWTPQEYLAWEAQSAAKHDYWDGQIYMLAGASPNHDRVVGNAQFELRSQLRGRSCEIFTSDIRVKTRQNAYTYPDVSVACGKAEFDEHDNLLNPTLLIEVLSPSTEKYDRETKWEAYQQLPSVQEYVVISQDQIRVQQYTRAGDEWRYRVTIGAEAVLKLAALGVEIPLAELYRRVEFPPTND